MGSVEEKGRLRRRWRSQWLVEIAGMALTRVITQNCFHLTAVRSTSQVPEGQGSRLADPGGKPTLSLHRYDKIASFRKLTKQVLIRSKQYGTKHG